MPLGRAVCLNARSFSLELLSLAVCPEDSIRPSAILCCHLWLPPALLGRSSQFPHPTSVAMSTKLRPTPSSCTLVYVGLNLAALKSSEISPPVLYLGTGSAGAKPVQCLILITMGQFNRK